MSLSFASFLSLKHTSTHSHTHVYLLSAMHARNTNAHKHTRTGMWLLFFFLTAFIFTDSKGVLHCSAYTEMAYSHLNSQSENKASPCTNNTASVQLEAWQHRKDFSVFLSNDGKNNPLSACSICIEYAVALKGKYVEEYLCMTAPAPSPLNHVRQGEHTDTDLFAEVYLKSQNEEKTKWAFFGGGSDHLPLCKTMDGQHPVLLCWHNVSELKLWFRTIRSSFLQTVSHDYANHSTASILMQ